MLARICDSCGDLLTENECIQLNKRTIKTNEDNHQNAHIVYGEYCKPCLDNGMALKDLLNDVDRAD